MIPGADSTTGEPAAKTVNHSNHIVRSARTVGILTLVSRVLGAVRDSMAAHVFGAGMVWDAFLIAWMIPNLFRRIFGEGALTSAFLPMYNKVREQESNEKADALASNVINLTAITLGVLVLLGMVAMIGCYLFLERTEKRTLMLMLGLILLPYTIFICLAAVVSGILHSHKNFFSPAAAPALLNVVWILALAGVPLVHWLGEWWLISITSVVVLLGGVLQLTMQFGPLRRCGFVYSKIVDPRQSEARQILKTMIPVSLGLGVVQVNTLTDNLIAEMFIEGDGAVSFLYYANRLMQFPLAIIGIAMAVAAFPTLSQLSAQKKTQEMAQAFSDACRMTLFFAVPATVGIVVLREPLIQLLFNHGEFRQSSENAVRCAAVLGAYAVGIWAHCLGQVVVRGFYALGDSTTPFRISIWMVALNFALNIAFVVGLGMKEAGLALATSLCGVLNVVILIRLLKTRVAFNLTASIGGRALRMAGASAVMGTASYGAYWVLLQWFDVDTWTGQIVQLGVPVALGLAVYFACAYCFMREELRELRRS